jgi:hypothetical protein
LPGRVQPPSPSAWARHAAAADAAFPAYGDGSEHFPQAGAKMPAALSSEEDIADVDEEDEEDADLQAALQVGTHPGHWLFLCCEVALSNRSPLACGAVQQWS